MNLTWHIIKKDLLQLRLPALLPVAILAGQVSVSSLLLSSHSVDLNWFYQMGMFFNLLVAVGLVVTYILVGILILDDPLTGTTMFWLTRPIAGGRLLGAKIVVVLLVFGVLPLLIWLPWWLHCGFEIRDIAVASGYILGLQAIAVFPAFVVASLVDQLGRFLLFSLLLVFALWVTLLNLATHTGLSHQLMLSRLLAATALLVPFGLAVIGWQYFSRRITAAVLILVTGALLSVTVIFWWPVNLSRFWPDDHREELAGAAQISGAISWARMSHLRNSDGSEIDTVVISLRFSGGPEDISLSDGLATVELRWADGQTIRQEQLRMAGSVSDSYHDVDLLLHRVLGLKSDEQRWAHHWDPATGAKLAELHAESVRRWMKQGLHINEPKNEPAFVTLSVTVPLTLSQAERIKSDPPACSINARIGAKRPEVLIEMPFASGTQMARNGQRLHLFGMGRTRRFEKQERGKPDRYTAAAVWATAPSFKNNVVLYWVERNHGVVRFLDGVSNVAFSAMPLAANIACMPLSFEAPLLWREDKWVEEPGWQDSSTLVSVIYRDVGGFNRDFHSDHLIVAKPESAESVLIQP